MSGPVAMITGRASGIASTSIAMRLMRGCVSIACVTVALKRSRSTASAPPAGTFVSSAAVRMSEPPRRSSSFKSPTALASAAPRSELEHTSSASPSPVCAGVRRAGFCS